MYQRYSEQNSWKVSVISSSEVGNSVAAVSAKNMQTFFFFFSFWLAIILFKAEKGGYKTYVMEVKGKSVYSKLKYESGVHRVQRVPQTEAQGRVHTSTATVAIMPEVHYFMPEQFFFCTCDSGKAWRNCKLLT